MTTNTSNMQIQLLQGDEAIAEGGIAAGCRFFAGYPITPASEIAELMARRLPQVGGTFIQMEDEIAAMGAVIGASLAGVKSMTATSGPGFSLKQENIGFACMAEIPCVIVNVQRAGPSTGVPTYPSQGDMMQARWGTHGDHQIIALVPYTVEECFWLTIEAFNLSEMFRTPVILLVDGILGHIREKIALPDYASIKTFERIKPSVSPENYLPFDGSISDVPPLANFGSGYRFHITGLAHDKTGFPTTNIEEVAKLMARLDRKITANKQKIIRVDTKWIEDAEIVIFAYGSVARSAIEAILEARESKDIKVGLFRPITIWPFPYEEIAKLAEKVKKIIVAEMNLGQIVYEVERAVCSKTKVSFIGRADGHIVTPEELLSELKKV